ncbi:MAG: Calx-beta domain-containing protein, partial [Methylococcaceae bacterium]
SAPPELSFEDISITEGNSGSKLATFQFTLSKAATDPVSVGYSTVDVTAFAGSDYTPQSGTLIFVPGETRKSLSISIVGDSVMEPNETFMLQLNDPVGVDLPKIIAIATIINDDKPKVSIAGLSTPEGNSGTTQIQAMVSLSAAATETVTVQYTTLDGTALADSDYTSTQGTLTFNPGEKTKPITLNIKGDTLSEGDEFLQLLISNPSGATLDPTASLARITLTDDDAQDPAQPQALPTLSLTDATVTEGQSVASFATLTVTLSTASSQPVTVNYSTQDGSATAGSDYVSTSNTLSFAPNQTTATIQVPILGDTQVEANESFKVNLSSPVNATLGSNNSAVVTVNNDDAAAVVLPTLSISGVKVKEGNSGSSTANATVTLSAASSETVTVNYATQDGTALANSDYIATSGTLSFRPGETSKTLPVSILGDTTVESDESFQMLLIAATNALLNPNAASGTVQISNDDTATAPVTSYSAGQPVIDLGSKYGKLIKP